MVDFTSVASILDSLFSALDSTLFGNVGIMVVFLIAAVMLLLVLFNANRFTVIGFLASLLLAFGTYGYTTIGWIAPLGAIFMGLMLGIVFIKLFQL